MTWRVFLAATLGAATAAQAQADLEPPRLRLAGRTAKLALRVELQQTTTSALLPGPQKQLVVRVNEYTVRAAEPGPADVVLEMVCDRVRCTLRVGGAEHAYDSTKDKPEASNPASAGAGVLVGSKVALHFSPDGRLLRVAGASELLKQMARQPGAPAEAEQIAGALGDEQFRNWFAGLFLHWQPKTGVAERDVWDAELTESFGGLGESRLRLQYTLQGFESEEKPKRRRALIQAAGKGKIVAGDGLAGLKLSAELVEREGYLRYDPQAAWFPDVAIVQTAKGTLTVLRAGTKVPLNIEQSTTTTATWTVGN
jgi:hypothetical protein